MQIVIGVVAAAVVLWLLLRWLANAPPRLIAARLRLVGGGLMLAGAAALAVVGRWGLAAPLAILGVTVIRGGVGAIDTGGGDTPRRSTVRSAMIEMELDHETGAMEGRVLAGAFAARRLDELADEELTDLWAETAADADSRALLESYLDRRTPGWRENLKGDTAAGSRSAPNAGAMGEDEAYEILGLAPGAAEAEIRAAHRRLMKGVHPDQGGSDFLAARINAAKDRLLGRHR